MDLPFWMKEDVTWPLLWGVLAIGVLGLAWFVTRRLVFLAAVLLCVGLLFLVILVEDRIVTDREYLVDAVYQLAEHVQNNDTEGILRFVDDDNTPLQQRIRQNMAQYDFSTCSMVGFNELKLDPENVSPRMARVSFTVFATGSEVGRGQGLYSSTVAVRLDFVQRDGRWFIDAYGYVAPANAQRSINMIRQ